MGFLPLKSQKKVCQKKFSIQVSRQELLLAQGYWRARSSHSSLRRHWFPKKFPDSTSNCLGGVICRFHFGSYSASVGKAQCHSLAVIKLSKLKIRLTPMVEMVCSVLQDLHCWSLLLTTAWGIERSAFLEWVGDSNPACAFMPPAFTLMPIFFSHTWRRKVVSQNDILQVLRNSGWFRFFSLCARRHIDRPLIIQTV